MKYLSRVVFSIFDERTGPKSVYSTIDDDILTKKIAVKSIVSTLTDVQGIQGDQVQGEAIIPFPTEGLIAFISYATLDQKTGGGENQVIALSTVTSDKDPSVLYKKATELSISARRVRAVLNQSFRIDQPINDDIKRLIREWGELTTEIPVTEPIVSEVVEVSTSRKFSQIGLAKLFPVKKSLLSALDPLAYAFFGLLTKTPLLLIGSNIEFLLEVAEVFQRAFTKDELSIRLSIAFPPQMTSSLAGHVQVGSSKIPRASIVVLNEEQYRKTFFYKDPLIVLNVNQDIETVNFEMEKTSIKTLSNMLKKLRNYDEESLAVNYLKEQILSFKYKMQTLQQFSDSGRKGRIKDVGKQLNIDPDTLFFIADLLRFLGLVNAEKINETLEGETQFERITIHAKRNVGFIR